MLMVVPCAPASCRSGCRRKRDNLRRLLGTALPQMKAVHETFDERRLAVVGLHASFEHHGAMTLAS